MDSEKKDQLIFNIYAKEFPGSIHYLCDYTPLSEIHEKKWYLIGTSKSSIKNKNKALEDVVKEINFNKEITRDDKIISKTEEKIVRDNSDYGKSTFAYQRTLNTEEFMKINEYMNKYIE